MNATSKQLRDEWLALRCQVGEPQAFAELVREMERPLLYFAQKLMRDEDRALDVLQEVWLKAFRAIGKLAEPRQLRAWLYQMTRSFAIDRMRKDIAQNERDKRHVSDLPDSSPEPTFDADEAEALHLALDQLELAHREVLVLHFLEDLSIAEVASIVQCPEGTVKSRIHHAKRALRTILTPPSAQSLPPREKASR